MKHEPAPPAFFTHFDRHAHGKGLKGASTHYCPGCGHGLVQKYLAESLAELGVQERTVLVSPVGCAVFMYYYLDVGNTQAAHGRAPAVALGHKLANPEAVVVSYQGDGDLASIGLAEIISAAQLGLPITVIFVNNAIYGMTGGQMAPTTLAGMTTTTSPYGRSRLEGEPLRVAEMLASLSGPIYIERVALYDLKTRKRAHQAIRKALTLQIEGRGFAFVEVLAECPTHLGLTGTEAEKWVEEQMTPIFPLGVYKDVGKEPWFEQSKPLFQTADLVAKLDLPVAVGTENGASHPSGRKAPHPLPANLDSKDVALKLAGAGGDGAQTAAMLLAKAAVKQGYDATHIPSYGPESRGGTSYADVHVAALEVLSPSSPEPHVLVAFNAPSLEKFGPLVRPGGVVVYDSSVVREHPPLKEGVKVYPVPCTEIAHSLGKTVVKNMVALGALEEATHLLDEEVLLSVLRASLADKCAMIPLNEEAYAWGARAVREGIAHFL